MNSACVQMTFKEKQKFVTRELKPKNDPLYLDGYEGGLIGWQTDANGNVHAVYSEEKCIDHWLRKHPYEDLECAESQFGSNVLRSLPYVDENKVPYVIHTFNEDADD